MRHTESGKATLAIAIILFGALAAAGWLLMPMQQLAGNLGVCLPSPNLWEIPAPVSFMLNVGSMVIVAFGMVFLNRSLNIMRRQDYLFPAVFLVMTASVPWLLQRFSSPVIMLLVNFICLSVALKDYKSKNYTQNTFAIATLLSVGSMVQYGFVFMVPAYIVIGIIQKNFRLREFCAMMLGLVAPYWVATGLGIVPVTDYHLPQLSNLFDGFATDLDLVIAIGNVGLTFLASLIMGLGNSIKLYAGNSRIRACNNSIAVLGLVCAASVVLDFNNMLTFLPTFYFAAAAQTAGVFALREIPKAWLPLAITAALYAAAGAAIILLPM